MTNFCCSRSSWSSTSTKQIEIERTKVRINAKGGGRKAEMSAQEVCLCLVYLRQNPFWNFGFTIWRLKLRLMTRSIIGLRFWETFYQLLKWKKLKDVQKYKNCANYYQLVDSTEQPIVRPIDELQKDYYWQEKMHTLKNQFIVLPQGQDIVDVTVGEVGKQVTLICFENTKINLANHKSFRR